MWPVLTMIEQIEVERCRPFSDRQRLAKLQLNWPLPPPFSHDLSISGSRRLV